MVLRWKERAHLLRADSVLVIPMRSLAICLWHWTTLLDLSPLVWTLSSPLNYSSTRPYGVSSYSDILWPFCIFQVFLPAEVWQRLCECSLIQIPQTSSLCLKEHKKHFYNFLIFSPQLETWVSCILFHKLCIHLLKLWGWQNWRERFTSLLWMPLRCFRKRPLCSSCGKNSMDPHRRVITINDGSDSFES